MQEIFFKLQRYTPIPFILIAWLFARQDPGLQIFGGLLIAIGIILRFLASAYLNTPAEKKEVLVTNGPYAFIRNPRYFGNILIYTGMVIAAGGLLPHLLWITVFFFSIQYISIARYEENLLTEKFGETYQLYTQQVPRFYPRLSPYPDRSQIKGNLNSAWQIEKNSLLILLVVVVLFELRWNFLTF
jgi:protein-S-isoprenylcysteine O-methyltransferase Ste14